LGGSDAQPFEHVTERPQPSGSVRSSSIAFIVMIYIYIMSSPFFKELKRKRPQALVTKFLRDLESGVFQTPRSFDVLSKFRTEELKLDKAGQRLRVAYHESPLIQSFCRKYPQVSSRASSGPQASSLTRNGMHMLPCSLSIAQGGPPGNGSCGHAVPQFSGRTSI